MKAIHSNPYNKSWMFGFPNHQWSAQASCANTNNNNNNNCINAVNIAEDTDRFDIEVALPGFEKEQISVLFDKLLLTISAEKPAIANETTPNYRRREFVVGSFKRTFELPKNVVDTQHIAARYDNGVLYVTLPKLKPAEVENTQMSISVN